MAGTVEPTTVTSLVDTCAAIHGAMALVLAGGYYQFGDRSKAYGAAVKDTRLLLKHLRTRIASALARKLEPVLSQGTTASVLLKEDGTAYHEQSPSSVGSESYRNAVGEFMDTSMPDLLSYRRLDDALSGWCTWSKLLGRLLLAALILDVLAIAGLGVPSKLGEMSLPNWLPITSLAVVSALLLAGIGALVVRHHYHDRIMDAREQDREV